VIVWAACLEGHPLATPWPFRYLDLATCWPDVVAELEQAWAARLPGTSLAALAGLDPSAPHVHASVGSCLLTLEPFQRCGPLELRDTRPTARERQPVYACPQRLRLIDTLVYALITYEGTHSKHAIQGWPQHVAAWDGIVALREAVRAYIRTRQKRPFPKGTPTAHRMQEFLRGLTAGVQLLTPENYRPSPGPRVPPAKVLLYNLMAQAFLDYGPRYPRAAMWDAIARIACHFGVEEEPELRPLVLLDQADGPDYARVAHRIDRYARRQRTR